MPPKILVIEDEVSIRSMLRYFLQTEGFETLEAEGADRAYQLLKEHIPDLILLDWMLPKESGIDIIKHLKNDILTRRIPVIMLTARAEEDRKVQALNVGADDYIVKPFSPRELMARIKALLRRTDAQSNEQVLSLSGIVINPLKFEACVDSHKIALRPIEFRLLHFLMSHPDKSYSRAQLLDRVWGQNTFIDERTVDATIKRLRHALRTHQKEQLIQTIRGHGYCFNPQEKD